MIEFEKWYKEKCKKEINPNVYLGAGMGWEAALEWVLNMFGANTFHGYPPINIEKTLKKELEL